MRNRVKRAARSRNNPIRTSILELIEILGELTSDDRLVVAAARHILTSCRAMARRAPRNSPSVPGGPHAVHPALAESGYGSLPRAAISEDFRGRRSQSG